MTTYDNTYHHKYSCNKSASYFWVNMVLITIIPTHVQLTFSGQLCEGFFRLLIGVFSEKQYPCGILTNSRKTDAMFRTTSVNRIVIRLDAIIFCQRWRTGYHLLCQTLTSLVCFVKCLSKLIRSTEQRIFMLLTPV